jgi:hypothetical protein
MESINKTIRTVVRSVNKINSETALCYSSYAIFALSVLYIFYNSQLAIIGLSLGVSLILYAVTGGNLAVSLIAGALGGLVTLHYSRRIERFANEKEMEEFEDKDEEENFEDVGKEEEEFEDVPKKKKGKKRAPPPDNGERAEMLELGKKYKIPSEEDDADYHLDAGTTFMNAYKSLKPDQIAAMTKDTQDLMSTQKQLMSTLQTLKPLIKDGKEMMDMFQGYFGSGSPSLN